MKTKKTITKPVIIPKIIEPTLGEKYVKKTFEYKAMKTTYKNEIRQLRYNASKQFRTENKTWFRTLDIIGIILILLNFGALFMTGVLVIKNDPGKSFVEANPVQCQWNGWSCHDNYADMFIPVLKQMAIWTVLVGLYIFSRQNTFSITGLWVLTLMMTFYTVALSYDFINDLGLYVGKILFGV